MYVKRKRNTKRRLSEEHRQVTFISQHYGTIIYLNFWVIKKHSANRTRTSMTKKVIER